MADSMGRYGTFDPTGRSELTPNWVVANEPLKLFSLNQIPFEGRNTLTSLFPSPSKSPATGISPDAPN